MKYNQPFDQTEIDAPYQNGNPVTGQKGSIPPAAAFETPQREIVHVIEAAGMIPTNSDLFQLLKAIKFFGGNIKQGIDTGTKNAVQVVLDPAPNSYDKLFCMVQKIATANDAAMTFAANGMAVKSLKDATGADLSSGALVGNTVFLAMYDGSSMRVLGGATTYNSISGLTANGGAVIDVTSSGGVATIAVNYDKPTLDTNFDPADILVRKIHGGGAHVKFTLQNFIDWINGRIVFPAGEDPIYLNSGLYKIRRATTTQIGVARKATGPEVAARAPVAGNPYVGPEDLPGDTSGVGIGALVNAAGMYTADGVSVGQIIGQTVSGDKFQTGFAIGLSAAISVAACLAPSSYVASSSGFPNAGWADERRSLFTSGQTWQVKTFRVWQAAGGERFVDIQFVRIA